MFEQVLPQKPDLLNLCHNKPGFFSALLESQLQNQKMGRYDVLFAAPSTELVAFDENQFKQLLKVIDCQPNKKASHSPFQYGWFVYFSYESSYLMEPKLNRYHEITEEPLAVAIYCRGSLVYDHQTGQTIVYADSADVLREIMAELTQDTYEGESVILDEISEEKGEHFIRSVNQAKKLIVDGDIYQANLSRQYTCHSQTEQPACSVYNQLKAANPAPFSALLQCNQFAIVSSSPERLLSIVDGVVETRPIAGTRPRSDDQLADAANIKELINTPKERAEHVMLIDLERNDIGKVCQTGSVEVDELMVIESYQHVHHIVSNIKGTLKTNVTVVDVIKSLFPGGTITGCPKIRCMEVIHDIESRPRGAYTGSLGYINHDGQVDLNILIRTVCINNQSIKFNAGAGIVFDSDPASELMETRHKAQGMINALTKS